MGKHFTFKIRAIDSSVSKLSVQRRGEWQTWPAPPKCVAGIKFKIRIFISKIKKIKCLWMYQYSFYGIKQEIYPSENTDMICYIRWTCTNCKMCHLPKHMSNGTNADDNIKCLPEGDSHSVKTIQLDERPEPGNNELIWFPNAPFHPLMKKSWTTCAFPASLRRFCEYSSFLIKARIDMQNTLSNGNPEMVRVYARVHSVGGIKMSF